MRLKTRKIFVHDARGLARPIGQRAVGRGRSEPARYLGAVRAPLALWPWPPVQPGQIRRLLQDCLFTQGTAEHALFVPPFKRRIVLKSAGAFEKAGNRFFHAVAGVLIIEASKQLYAATPAHTVRVRRRRLVAISGRGTPLPSEHRGA